MKYYICPECGTTYRDKEFDELHYGLCWCKYVSYHWNNEFLRVEIQIDRILIPCVRINKKWFNILDVLPNRLIRLSYFNAIPKKRRLK